MSKGPVDLGLLRLATPDEAFRQSALDFIHNNAPTAYALHLRPELDQLVYAFLDSSKDNDLQELLFLLHTRYNLDGLLDESSIRNLRENVIVSQASRGAQYRENARMDNYTGGPHQSLDYSQLPPTSTISTAPAVREYTFINVSPAEAAEIREEDTEAWEQSNPYHEPVRRYRRLNFQPPIGQGVKSNPPPPPPPIPQSSGEPRRCHPPNLDLESILVDKHPDWEFECDECGHPTRYRTEFVRHFKEQPGFRDGFQIVSTRTETNPMWYGKDAGDNEYMGPMIFNPKLAGQKRSSRTRVNKPCGPRIKWLKLSKLHAKTEKQRAIGAKKDQKKTGNRRKDGEDEKDG